MLRQLKNCRLYVMFGLEALIFAMAYVSAHLLRFEFLLTAEDFRRLMPVLAWLIPLKLAVFFAFGLYRGMWRFSGLHDLWHLTQACIVSSLIAMFLLFSRYHFLGFSRAVFLLDCVLTFLMAGGLRMGIRICYSIRNGSMIPPIPSLQWLGFRPANLKRILIIGAGGSGEKILREIFDNSHLDYKVVGFLDDDPAKRDRTIHGVPVLGSVDTLPRALESGDVGQVFISTPSATSVEMRRIVDICKDCGVPFKTLPAIGQIIDGNVSIKSLRDVNYEDLLRRPPVHLDTAGINDYLSDRTVLITGGGGSIGSELCRQVIRFNPRKVVLLDAGEANLYGIQMELRHEIRFPHCHAVLAKVQNKRIVEEIFKTHRPDVVFHAAAYKHVPLLERNPWEAIWNNVTGSRTVMEMAAKYRANRFVLVSTDKAVRPTNVMGTSKRLCELVLQSMQGNDTRFMAVRFGNVLASSGSVIPLFQKQIEHGGPVTVTHPEVTRYFMTIPEAAQLILQAGALGKGGEIFVLEMGTPVRIADMAEDLIRLSGKEPGRDIEIVFTGLRAGEKLYEELITHDEHITRTAHDRIMVLEQNGKPSFNSLDNPERFHSWLENEIQELCHIAQSHDAGAIKQKLRQIVPEYTPQEAESVI